MAGIVRRRPEAPRFDEMAGQLQTALSRTSGPPRQVLQGPHHFFVKIDFGFFESAGVLERPDAAAVLCGEPLVLPGQARAADLAMIANQLLAGSTEALGRSRGSFALACFLPSTGTLLLATDKVGVRPLFLWVSPEYVVFASALRVLEAIPTIPKQLDLRGVTEESAFGYPLGDRTPYVGIRYLRAGELVAVAPHEVQTSRYHRWDRVSRSIATEDELAQAAYERFREAMEVRRKGILVQHAFLSGGLDSRCVVSHLRGEGCEVHTYSYGLDNSQELAFAEAFAKAAGAIHRRVPMPPGSWAYPTLDGPSTGPSRGEMIWTGDGGSVALGHVYLTRPMVDHARAGALGKAVERFRAENTIGSGSRFLASAMPDPDQIVTEGILQELDGYDCDDPGRLLFLFLLENDQRRHLLPHFEELDTHRQEFQVPFFDADFLSTVIATPIDWCLGHRLYSRTLSFFPPVTVSVPWQTYPGHDPCPLPFPPELGYQWQAGGANPRRDARRRSLLTNTQRILHQRPFPSGILNRGAVWAAYWLTRLRIRNYEYALAAAAVYERYWRISKLAATDPAMAVSDRG